VRWAVLSFLGACGFSGAESPPTGEVDASVDALRVDAPMDLDAPPDTPPAWRVVETLLIDTAKSTPMTSMALASGVTYRLRASGEATVIDGQPGDAEYWDYANNAPRDSGCCEDVGIGIDDPVIDLDTRPDWGPYNPDHIYEIEWMGTGAPIQAQYQDTFYGNNVGELTLEIYAYQ
jgi:hypothetical protein